MDSDITFRPTNAHEAWGYMQSGQDETQDLNLYCAYIVLRRSIHCYYVQHKSVNKELILKHAIG
jgi:hypothetical protein